MGLLQKHSLPALAVAWEGRLVGIFFEEMLFRRSIEASAGGLESISALSVGEMMAPLPVAVREETPLPEVMQQFRMHMLPAIPVVDEAGNYRGIIPRQEALAALCDIVHAGPLAGMATPLGVYLTNGKVRAGAGDAGLFLTGVVLALMWNLSSALLNGIYWAVQQWTSLPLLAIRLGLTTPMSELYFGNTRVWAVAFLVGQMAGFFLLMRLLPLSGTHGAEHQVVHTIENGEELTPENVRSHTTVHPRCGTNLVAMMIVIGAGIYYFTVLRTVDSGSLVFYISLVVIIALFLRQRIGAVLQWLMTTRRPSPRQTQAAIRVGKDLLMKCRLQDNQPPIFLERLYNMGLLQVLSGAVVTGFLLETAGRYLERWLLL
jgi:hypothetical protein